MKQLKIVASFVLAAVLLTTGCGSNAAIEQNEYEKALLGKWSYVHEPDVMVATFKTNGDATFEGKHYTYSCDGSKINLTGGSKPDLNLRYVQNEDSMYVYIQSTYTKQNPGTSDGIVGVWLCEERNWTFEFTANGTFMEDGALTGYYLVDEESKTVQLIYGEALEDTYFYYQMTDDGLFIEYPWLMRKMK